MKYLVRSLIRFKQLPKTLINPRFISISSDDNIDKVIQKLDNCKKKSGFVFISDVDKVIRLAKSSNYLSSDHALKILQYSGCSLVDEIPNDRLKLLEIIWPTLVDLNVNLDIRHFNALLKSYCDNNLKNYLSKFIELMKSFQIKPDRFTYEILIEKCCNEGRLIEAIDLLESMANDEMPINESIFHSMLKGYILDKDLESAEKIMDIMKSCDVDLDSNTFTTYLSSMIQAGYPLNEVWNVKTKFYKQNGFSLNHKNSFVLVEQLVKQNQIDNAKQLCGDLSKRQGYFNALRTVIPKLLLAGNFDLPFDLLTNLRTYENEPKNSYNHGNFFISMLVKLNYPIEDVMKLLDFLYHNTNKGCVNRAIEICIRNDKMYMGEQILQNSLEKFGKNCFSQNNSELFIRSFLTTSGDATTLQTNLRNIFRAKLNVSTSNLLRCVLPLLLETKNIKEISDYLFNLNPQWELFYTFNNIIKVRLARYSKENVNDILWNMLLYSPMLLAKFWHQDLGRMVINRNNFDELADVMIILICFSNNSKASINSDMVLKEIYLNLDPITKISTMERILKTFNDNQIPLNFSNFQDYSLFSNKNIQSLVNKLSEKNMLHKNVWDFHKKELFFQKLRSSANISEDNPKNLEELLQFQFKLVNSKSNSRL